MTKKAPDAFRTISEAAKELDLPQHVLRHWEDTFGAIRPMRRAGGRRYYRQQDLYLIKGVQALLHGERYTTKGVQKIFKDQGASFVLEVGKLVFEGESPEAALAAHSASQTSEEKGVVIPDQTLQGLVETLKSLKAEIADLRKSITPPS
ncbi:MAG: MerR family transcriptional regulator [Pseudomonadota bacterium]